MIDHYLGTSQEGDFFDPKGPIKKIGGGSSGGKAEGLARVQAELKARIADNEFPGIEINIPPMLVLGTEIFERFMAQNHLHDIATSDSPDDHIAMEFQKGDLPFEALGDLRSFISSVHTPLAVRSSSLLEDRIGQPFAGVYNTKMIPNNQFDTNIRFRKLTEAIKFVYASQYMRNAKDYIKSTPYELEDEKMAVIIQKTVGRRHGQHYYPDLSGVARSFNYYPMGRAAHEDGVIHLAMGLGKTIVDGDISWSFSPRFPKVTPPYRTVKELLQLTQTQFWSINLGEPPRYDPIRETEYLEKRSITAAEKDGTLELLASTYDPYGQRLTIGIGSEGPRVLTFAPLLVINTVPINALAQKVLRICEDVMESAVEIEFAMTFNPHRFGFLQVRPMCIFDDKVEISDENLSGDHLLLASESVLGNGINENIRDVVYVSHDKFESKHTHEIARELTEINRLLVEKGIPYLLVVFGRLGTTDPWLGIPLDWAQVSGAEVVVEATRESFNVVLSQGSHFFHNLSSHNVKYFCVPTNGQWEIDWDWLDRQERLQEKNFIRHVRLPAPLSTQVDGRRGLGCICKPGQEKRDGQ